MLPVNQTQPDDTSGQSSHYEVAETPSAHKMKSRSSRFLAFSVITKEVVPYVADHCTKDFTEYVNCIRLFREQILARQI